ncbi:hypothetical protein DEU56DRAFT_747134, partial [Suillus clintonianus]|uniref:uncharacterized protein n=1 Tax=Suillus clintonianus TaxID=1904413 RepID=UPI001B85D278
EELLIHFHELVGEHSGENMAQAVFETLHLFGLKGRVLAIMADNASNNDTMCEELQKLCEQAYITFNAQQAQLRCLPHTTHLSALVVGTNFAYFVSTSDLFSVQVVRRHWCCQGKQDNKEPRCVPGLCDCTTHSRAGQ